jgi:hypothetical protein
VHGRDVRQLAVECVQGTDYAVAEPYRAPHNCVEDRLHVGRGARYHSQDFAGRCLLLPRVGELTGLAVELFLQIGD